MRVQMLEPDFSRDMNIFGKNHDHFNSFVRKSIMAHVHLAEKQLSTEDYEKAQKDYDPDGKPVSIDIAEAQVIRKGVALKLSNRRCFVPECRRRQATRRPLLLWKLTASM